MGINHFKAYKYSNVNKKLTCILYNTATAGNSLVKPKMHLQYNTVIEKWVKVLKK
jgi:hypothetical protein